MSLKSKRQPRINSKSKQQGVILILMAFIVGLAATALVIKSYSTVSLQAERNEDTMRTLMQAKEALLAWSIAHPNWPGVMPFPDRNGDGDYDGESDCVTSGLNTTHLLGKLPLLGEAPCITPQDGLGIDAYDSSGEKLWYAVSMNLIRTNGSAATPVINPGIIDNPTNSWMVLRDSTGAIISDRVAVVILAPGAAINGQNRSGAAPSQANFLDQMIIGGTTYSNFDYDTDDEDFIIADTSAGTFNDKLVYITIDELMAALERRVGEVVRAELKEYQDTNGYYPYAAQIGTTQNYSGEQNQAGTDGLTRGFLPVNYQSCTATFVNFGVNFSTFTCVHPIFDSASTGVSTNSGITEVRITKSGGFSFNPGTNQACTVSPLATSRCTCNGPGSCNGLDTFVTCTNALCNVVSFTGVASYRVTGGKFTHRTGGCAHNTFPTKNAAGCYDTPAGNSVLTCGTTAGTIASSNDARFDTVLPAWFTANNWQDYVYYHFTRPAAATMSVGAKDTDAVVVTVGRPIDDEPFASKGSAQARPSCNALNEYLDSAENADGDSVYDATSTPRSPNYNDQTFVVSP